MITKGVVGVVAGDLNGIIKSLQTCAVNRCRERLDEAALRAKGLIGKGEGGEGAMKTHDTVEYGVTSVLKRRHGL